MAYYLDTSALVKMVVQEEESPALAAWATAGDRQLVTGDLSRTELMRATRRSDPELAVRAREVLDSMIVIAHSTETFDAAGRLDPLLLRSLDALHVAAALELEDDLEGLVTYDHRMAEAARAQGIPTVSPSTTATTD